MLEESLSEEDRVRFGNLVGAHKEKMRQVIRSHIETMIRQRRYVTSLREELEAQRLIRAGTELFARIYKSPIPFPFDGFSTAKGNAADSCQDLTVELLRGKLDYDAVIAKPTRTKNRAITVLKDTWGVFSKDGKLLIRPSYPVVRTITEKWDGALAAGEKRLPIALVLRQLCQPPHGANVASAAMLLGVFVAPRSDRLIVVRDGQQIALSQWLQDGVFKGKFIDVRAQASTDLMLLGEESSEWEALLKEWEQAETYFDRSECLERCIALRRRIPVPPALGYLCTHLEQRAQDAIKALKRMEAEQNDAMERIERGEHHEDAGMVAWGAADLVKLSKEMATQGVVWADWQVNEMQPHVERAKQVVVQMFPEWLRKQAPLSDAPSIVGDWKHKMLRLTGGNLKALSLEEQYNALEQRVLLLARNAESVAEARQLVRDVGNWLAQHTDACRIVRVAAIRGLVEIGKGFASRLQGMGTRVALPEVSEMRSRLADSLQQLKDAQEGAKKRASKLLGSKPRSAEELEGLRADCDDLIRVFEGCEADLRDLHALGRGIGVLQRVYARLEDERLTWTEFEGLAIALEQEVTGQFEPGELPWSIDETIGLFVKTLSRSRKDRGETWVRALESDAEPLEGMSAADANRLHIRASAPPAYLTDKQLERTAQVMERIEIRLSALAVEWFLEKFKELPSAAREAFLEAAGRLMKR